MSRLLLGLGNTAGAETMETHTHTHTRKGRGHETVDEEICADALRRPEFEAMRAWAKNLRRRSHGAKTLLGTFPEQRNRSIPSGPCELEASGWLRFAPLWETSGLSLAAVRLRLSSGRLRSSEIAAYRQGLAYPKPLA